MSDSFKNKNPFDSSKDYELSRVFDSLVALKARTDQALKKAEQIAGFTDGMAFHELAKVKFTIPVIETLRESGSGWGRRQRSLTELKNEGDKIIKETLAKIEAIEAHNAPLIEHNNHIRNSIIAALAKVGITEQYTTYEYPNARSRNRKSVSHRAGFLGDLDRVQPRSDTAVARDDLSRFERNLEEYIKRETEKELLSAKKADEEAMAKTILVNPSMMSDLLAAGVNLSDELQKAKPGTKQQVIKNCVRTAINNLLNKDKYLRLAHYLERNRENWNEGSHYAQMGLDSFKVETEVDQKIFDCIDGLITNWSGDGRVFRDCQYNYNVIYSMVADKDLRELLDKVRSHEEVVER